MDVQGIVEVLRRPYAANALYHAECYTWDEKEVVHRVLRLIHDEECVQCGMSLSRRAIMQLCLFEDAA